MSPVLRAPTHAPRRVLSRRATRAGVLATGGTGVLAVLLTVTGVPAYAAQPVVGLGTATSYAVLAGSGVSNTGPSVIGGDIGLSPQTAVTGFPPGVVTPPGTTNVANGVAANAKADLKLAYDDAAGRTPVTTVSTDLGGRTLQAGVYKAAKAMSLTGTLTLDGGPDDVFIFQAGSTLKTASDATVALTGGASACNIFWQVGSSATLGTDTVFVGTIMALTSAQLLTRTRLTGRVLARNGAVTLDTNVIDVPDCDETEPSAGTPTATSSPTATPSTSGGSGTGGTGSSGTAGTGTTGSGGTSGTTGTTTTASGTIIPGGHPETGRTPVSAVQRWLAASSPTPADRVTG